MSSIQFKRSKIYDNNQLCLVLLLILLFACISILFHPLPTHTITKSETKQLQLLRQAVADAATKRDRYLAILNSTKSQVINGNLVTSKENIIENSYKNDQQTHKSKGMKSKLHAVTYASHGGRDDRFCRAIESAIRNNIDLIILGWGLEWHGLSQKLEAAYQYALSLPDDDIILFTDAFDVLYTQSSDIILEKFLSFNNSIIFSSECGCWPQIQEGKDICLKKYPQSPTPYRYLNSGAWIAYAKPARAMLKQVIDEAGKNFADANDQKLISDLYINNRFDIKLDYNTLIFQSTHMTLDPPLPYCDPNQDLQLLTDSNLHTYWYNKLTKNIPSLFHFNGGGKVKHLLMEKKVWYKDKKYNTYDNKMKLKLFNVSVLTSPTGKLEFDKLCPGYVDQEYK